MLPSQRNTSRLPIPQPPTLPSCRTDGAGRVYTTMDFLVSSPRWQRANLSTYVMSGQSLYTLNCQCSAQNASDRARMFQVVTDNFAVAPRAPGQ